MRKFRAIITLFLILFFSVPVFATNQVFIPHLTDGNNQWCDYLTIDNTGLDPAEVVVTLYDIDGNQIYQGQHSIEPMGETLINVRNLAETASSGKIEIPDSGDIHCRLSLESLVGGGVAEFRLDASQSSILAFLYSDFPEVTIWKGLSVANYGDVAGKITFYAYGNGELLATSKSFDIGAHEKLVGVPSLWFPEIGSNEVKKIIAVSTLDTLGGLAIAGDSAIERLLFTAAVTLGNFTSPEVDLPKKTLTGTWNGHWMSNYGDWGSMVVRMTQNDGSIVGTADFYGTVCGDVKNVSVTGTVTGNQVVINISYRCGSTPATLTALGSFDDNSIDGKYQLKAPEASYYDSGSLTLTKQ